MIFTTKLKLKTNKMANPNANANLTNKDKWTLEAKAKQGWKCYFIERDHIYELQQHRNTLRAEVERLREDGGGGSANDYDHLKQMFLDLYARVGELCDCPVCFETLSKDLTAVPLCGHLVCKECKARMVACPICRKTY